MPPVRGALPDIVSEKPPRVGGLSLPVAPGRDTGHSVREAAPHP